MESRDSMGVPPGPSGMMPGSGSFGAMLQRSLGSAPGGSSPTTIPGSLAPSSVLRVPAATRVVSAPVLTVASNTSNPSLPPYSSDISTAIVPHPMSMSMGMGIAVGMGIGRAESVKRKRGRPRKYGPDGSMALALAPLSTPTGPVSPSQKRGRGRPPGSGRKQQLAALGGWLAGSAGVGFTPHVITIAAGEDVASKIMSFSQQGPRAICILSANGAISNVTLRQPATSGGTVTYEGRFEILSLSGSFLLTETGGTRSRTGGLSVSLAGPDGRVVGGGVAGMLMAATPVQVVVGSFLSNGKKNQTRPNTEMGSSQGAVAAMPVTAIPVSRQSVANLTGPDSPLDYCTESGTHPPQGQNVVSSLQSSGWPHSQTMMEGRRTTDINISLPGG